MKTHPLHLFKYCPKCGSAEFVIHNDKSKKCNDCGFVYYFNSASSTVGVIFNEKGELLVAVRAKNPFKGTLDLPGGFVDPMENAEDAIRREIKEETNLDVSTLHFLFSVPNTYVYSDFKYNTTDLVFECHIDSFANLKADDDVASLQFIALEKLHPDDFGLTSMKEIIQFLKDNYK